MCRICNKNSNKKLCKLHRLYWRRFIWVKGLHYLPEEDQVKYILAGMKKLKLKKC